MSENEPKPDVGALAGAYDDMVKTDLRLRLELEAKERMFQDKQTAKRLKKVKEEENKKKVKKALKKKRRARFHWF